MRFGGVWLGFSIGLLCAGWGALASPLGMAQGPVAKGGRFGDAQVIQAGSQSGLQTWIAGFRHRALAAGISASTFDRAMGGVHLREDVIEKDRNQSEFVKPIWEYLDRAVSDTRVENGRAALRKYRRLLDGIEARYGVDREVVVAIWGMESSYGDHRGDIPVIDALTTLAYEGRRGRFFEAQLIDALRIVQHGDVALANFTGSWAGAMGHTQFIPSSYQAFAVDYDGDGRRDIWADDPGDALASTAAYLAKSGWVMGRPWGVEVTLPAGFDYAHADRARRSVAEWRAMGLRLADGGAIPDHGPAALLLPAGARGVALLTFANFHAIERYNAADAYVIGVGHLSDRLRGGAEFRASWPRDDRALTFAERQEMQERLTRAGYDTGGADGKIGPKTLAALRAFQRSVGMPPDGYPSLDVLKRLR